MQRLNIAGLGEHGFISQDWAEKLAPMDETLRTIGDFLQSEDARGVKVLPSGENVLRAFQLPLAKVRVLIVGQDPYPTPGHPIGLSFAAERHVRPIPRSLQNIYRELHDDLGIPPAEHGDLSNWFNSGVMLLNRVLTVRAGEAASHRRRGWEEFTEHAIRVLVDRGGPLVAVLWGNDARSLKPLLSGIDVIESAHPSPLSASRGFFGSRPFSRVNESLGSQRTGAIDWRVL